MANCYARFNLGSVLKCRNTVNYKQSPGTHTPGDSGKAVFCSYTCYKNLYTTNSGFRASIKRQAVPERYVIYIECGPNGVHLVDAHSIRWFMASHALRHVRWDLWNVSKPANNLNWAADLATVQAQTVPTQKDKHACMCLTGRALTCKVAEGEHWGQPNYKGGKR